MSTLSTDLSFKNPNNFVCEIFDYITSNIKDLNKHLLTKKHISNQSSTIVNIKIPIECQICNKKYKDRTGLWRHNKTGKCTKQICTSECAIPEIPHDKDNIIMLLIKQNDDLIKGQTNLIKEHSDLIKEQSNLIKEQTDIKQIILELVKNGTNNSNTTNNTIHNNSHNKAFNLNFFLNETCKNAMNITEFVDSIKWEKEDEEMKRLRKIILRISNKSMKLLPKYREKFPDYDDAKSIRSDELCKIIIEAVTCDSAKDEKIIRNISKATMISKEALQVV